MGVRADTMLTGQQTQPNQSITTQLNVSNTDEHMMTTDVLYKGPICLPGTLHAATSVVLKIRYTGTSKNKASDQYIIQQYINV